jgi:quinol-cytochrome oxidoreductase complex cytochrome b subunit
VTSIRLWAQGILVSIVLQASLLLVQIAEGIFLTARHEPGIASRYASADYLQSEASFGVAFRTDWFITAMEFAVPALLYVLFRHWTAKKTK